MLSLGARNHQSSIAMPAILIRLVAGVVLLLTVSAAACGTASGVKQTILGYDLADRFRPVRKDPLIPEGPGSFVRHYEVIRNGTRRDAMLLVAPAEIQVSLAGIAGHVVLEGLATPVFNIGDGIQMEVFLADSHGRRKVFGCRFDPGRRAQDRAWIPVEIPIDLDGAADSQMEIRVTPGIQGDLVADWLALSSMRLVPRGNGR